nr:hypothetical protein [Tanacetum cinerariifolium]
MNRCLEKRTRELKKYEECVKPLLKPKEEIAKSSVPPITIEDYEIVGTDGPKDSQGNDQGNVASFPTVEFEKEELDTTPECDPPS